MLHELFRRGLRFEPAPAQPVPLGLHHYYREADGAVVRYHLRVDSDGSGLLLCNARSACRLSPAGVMAAHGLLERRSDGETLARLRRSFHGVGSATLHADLKRVKAMLGELAAGRGPYPLKDLDDPDGTLHRRTLGTPLAAEVAVGEGTRELLRALWEGAVPQVVFDAGDAPAETLVGLVEHAEDLGLITGVRASGTALAKRKLVKHLAAAGLDHLDVLFAGDRNDGSLFGNEEHEAARAALTTALQHEVCPVGVVPLTYDTLERFGALARELVELRVGAVIVFALVHPEAGAAPKDGALSAAALRQAATSASECADRYDLDLLWAPPVERVAALSLAEQAGRGPRVSSEGRIRVEADGRVLPPVGPTDSVGRLGRDTLAKIWAHERFRAYREAADDPVRCVLCPRLVLCAAGCPVDPTTWSRGGVA